MVEQNKARSIHFYFFCDLVSDLRPQQIFPLRFVALLPCSDSSRKDYVFHISSSRSSRIETFSRRQKIMRILESTFSNNIRYIEKSANKKIFFFCVILTKKNWKFRKKKRRKKVLEDFTIKGFRDRSREITFILEYVAY